jgi:CrcB protein
MQKLLLVMIGGALGAGLRYEVGRLAVRQLGPAFPWGTLAVNLAGGLAMGLLAGSIGIGERPAWFFAAVGVLGGFTTFSAFSLELFGMMERGQMAVALVYAGASVLGSVALLAAGWALTRSAA